MADSEPKFVVWERMNKSGKWLPYSADVSQLLEQSWKKNEEIVALESVDDSLKIYKVDLKNMQQVSEKTGTKCSVKRRLCDSVNEFCQGYIWQWCDNHDVWHSYDVEISNFIEQSHSSGSKGVTLKQNFRGYNYEIDFIKMCQINKQTKRKRPIRREQLVMPYPVDSALFHGHQEGSPVHDANRRVDSCYSELLKDIPGASVLMSRVNSYMQSVQGVLPSTPSGSVNGAVQSGTVIVNTDLQNPSSAALVNGHPWTFPHPPPTPESAMRPVPGIEALPLSPKKPKRKKKKGLDIMEEEVFAADTILEQYTNKITVNSQGNEDFNDKDCIICCESLNDASTYDCGKTVLQLKLCSHVFHKGCLEAMYNSGPKDRFLQCPTCKKIHGEKWGLQPPGNMTFHVLPYSLPGHHDCDTIRIIYDFHSGIQGEGHPKPGKKYTARGFPRHCYLPDNEIGRKILRLLIKAWKRRLMFTIGRSSTTGEENTVTWNEIHHKTEFGCNRRGHGYPDANYFANVISELAAHGVVEDEVYRWYPA